MTLLVSAVIGAYVMALCAFAYCIHLAVVYQRFTDGIKDWASNLDASTKDAINRSARQILLELDDRISAQNAENEDVELLNNQKNEEIG